jgi:uncharacterized protein
MNQHEDITLVVGASENPLRYSNIATKRLLENGYKVICFGNKAGKIATVEIDTHLPAHTPIHTITMYVNPGIQHEMSAELLKLNPKRIIFNPGTENPALEKQALEQGIETLQACTLVLLSTGMYSNSTV